MTLREIIESKDLLPVSRIRIHPHIDVGNGDGPMEMSELSHEYEGGGWVDLGYFHSDEAADYAAHAMNMLPKLVAAGDALVAKLRASYIPVQDNWAGEVGALVAVLAEASNPEVPQ